MFVFRNEVDVSLDGAKVKANASRHKAMSYEYMQKEEGRLHKEIAELAAKAKSADEADDALHGRDKRGDELPAELSRQESRLARIQEAKKALETQVLEAARVEEAHRDVKDEQRRQSGETVRKGKPVDATPKPKAQYNFTDPESKIMKIPADSVTAPRLASPYLNHPKTLTMMAFRPSLSGLVDVQKGS